MKWPVSQPCLLLVTDEQLLDLGTELLYELSILLKIIPVLNTFNCIRLADKQANRKPLVHYQWSVVF